MLILKTLSESVCIALPVLPWCSYIPNPAARRTIENEKATSEGGQNKSNKSAYRLIRADTISCERKRHVARGARAAKKGMHYRTPEKTAVCIVCTPQRHGKVGGEKPRGSNMRWEI